MLFLWSSATPFKDFQRKHGFSLLVHGKKLFWIWHFYKMIAFSLNLFGSQNPYFWFIHICKNILFVLLNNCLCWWWYKNAWFSSSWYWWWLVFALFAGVCDGGGVYCVVSHSLCGVCDVRRWCDFPSPWTSLAPPLVPFWHCALVCSLLPLFVPIVDFWILF